MHKSFLKSLVLAVVTALTLTLSPSAFSQIVSSGITGTITGADGKGLVGATVTAVHGPTNAKFVATSRQSGNYDFRGLPVGGPYTITVTADGYSAESITDVTTELGELIDVNVVLKSDVLKLEKYVVSGSRNDLDSTATGTSSVIGKDSINNVATVQRSFADVARTTPFVSLRGVLVTRQQPIISAVGQNNRFNSVLVDGARINDQFGLNGSGLQAFGNPISIDTIEQFHVAVSPYDARQSGFTGVAINAVTKSGTNEFHGSLYYYYTDQDLQNANVFGSTTGLRAPLKQTTKGLTLGGPILKDKLFFFLNYEKFNSTAPDISGLNMQGTPQGQADFTAITTRLGAIKSALSNGSSFDFGTNPGATGSITQFNEIKLGKLDWNITKDQRFSIRYNKTSGELPDSGRFKNGGSLGTTVSAVNTGSGASANGITAATFATNLTSNWFKQVRNEEVWAAQLFSQWSADLKTELRYSQNEYTQQTPTPILFPEVRIFGVSGIASNGATVPGTQNTVLVFGTEVNRQGNVIKVNTKNFGANGEYLWRDVTFTGGYDREESKFFNLFRGGSYGIFDYANVADFLADIPRTYSRSFYTTGTVPADISNFAVNGLYSQAKWKVNHRFTAIVGLRYDFFTAGKRPPFNQALFADSGIRNDGSINGSHDISPRLSFNYALTESRSTQLRGGIGKFVGRIPWVIVSNSYGNSGVDRFQVSQRSPAFNLVNYLQTQFDPTNPIGTSAGVPVRPQVNLIQNKLSPPTLWRGNLAVDQKIPGFFDSTLTAEVIHSRASKALFYRDLNIKPSFVGSDGRTVFAGALSSDITRVNPALYPNFTNLYEVSNNTAGKSTYLALTLARPMKNHWSYSLTYTRGRAEDAFPLGETVAGSFFGRNPVFNQNVAEVTRSAFEVRDRIQVSIAREFEFIKNSKTTISLYYEGRSGNPYSFVYAGDVNQDGVSFNDLVYVPKDGSDPVLGTLSSTAKDQLLAFVDQSGLAKYAGKYAPRHAFFMPWTNRLDLHVSQMIPLHFKNSQLEVFADFVNFGSWFSKKLFGYYETIQGGGDNELLATRTFGAAAYNATTGQLAMTGTAFTPPPDAVINNDLSRWRIQLGARLKF